MKKTLCILFFISILLISCTKFEEVVVIHPKVHLVGDIIGLKYDLYNWHILDESIIFSVFFF